MSWRRPKYNAVRSPKGMPGYVSTLHDGLSTASKAEAGFYAELDHLLAAGVLRWWMPQVSFTVGTDERGRRVVYVCDALVLTKAGTTIILDRKGMDTPTSRAKRACVRVRYSMMPLLVVDGSVVSALAQCDP